MISKESQRKVKFLLLPTVILFLDGVSMIQSMPSSSRPPPALPQYYPSPTPPRKLTSLPSPHHNHHHHGPSSLAPTSPVYVAQRLRSSSDDENERSANSYLPGGGSGDDYEENPNNNGGFVEPIDFSGLLKDVGNSPKVPTLNIQGNNDRSNNPLFTSESKDNFQGFFNSKKNPFEDFSKLSSSPSNLNSRQHSTEDENVGFVDPNVQFRSLFDSSPTVGFQSGDFLGSAGSQTRAYPSFTYSGRQSGDDDYPSEAGPASPDYYQPSSNNNGGRDSGRNYNDELYNNDGASASPYSNERDSYSNSNPGRSSNRNYEKTPRYTPQSSRGGETSSSPQQSQSKESSSSNPRCKRVEKNVEYSDDHGSFTDPEPDYDPSTYRGRYKRQARQRSRTQKRPMVCFVCEDERGRYAEKCSFDSNASPNDKGRNYFHAESSSFSDNGNNNGRGHK